MKLGEALIGAREVIPAAEARLLLLHTASVTATELAAHPERELAPRQVAQFLSLVSRRAAGEPVAYLVGRREFYGREFAVSPAVLIPRPETELLVESGIARMHGVPRPRILDLGTGSGCVAITLALELAAAVTAVDASADALAVACANAKRLGARVEFVASDWFSAVVGRFDLIVANPPYVAQGDPHLSAGDLRFEPPQALASGADGLSAIRRIVAEAPGYLTPNGWLLFEHGYDQAQAVRELLASVGFADIEQHRDLVGIIRVSGGHYSLDIIACPP
jgi:release factor glutamine methyltransferase